MQKNNNALQLLENNIPHNNGIYVFEFKNMNVAERFEKG